MDYTKRAAGRESGLRERFNVKTNSTDTFHLAAAATHYNENPMLVKNSRYRQKHEQSFAAFTNTFGTCCQSMTETCR